MVYFLPRIHNKINEEIYQTCTFLYKYDASFMDRKSANIVISKYAPIVKMHTIIPNL